jgi:hypothetical protein
LRSSAGDLGIDRVTVRDDRRDELAGQGGSILVAFLVGQVALQYGVRGALPEVRFEDRSEGESATGPPAADAVSPRRHRRGP